MEDKKVIAGEEFPVKLNGMTLVDSYYIVDEDLEDYLYNRERFADMIVEEFKKHYKIVTRDFKGSEDGEAVLGLNNKDRIENLIHLDPSTIGDMLEAEKDGDLEVYLRELIV